MQFLFSFKRPGSFILIFFSILFVLPFLAPILSSFGANSFSRIIYFIYSWFCHQFHTRSLYLFDHQCAWCARDTGIWAGVLLSSWFYLKGFVGRIRWFYLPIFILPILLDGGTQTISSLINVNQVVGSSGEYFSNNFLRFVTGAWLGIGIGLWIVPNISEVISLKIKSKDENADNTSKGNTSNNGETSLKIQSKVITPQSNLQLAKFNVPSLLPKADRQEASSKHRSNRLSALIRTEKNYLKIIFIQLLLILLYVFLVLLWNITSQTIKPTNVIDSIPKTQEVTQFERRKYGECPSKGNDIFNLDCFLYGTETKL